MRNSLLTRYLLKSNSPYILILKVLKYVHSHIMNKGEKEDDDNNVICTLLTTLIIQSIPHDGPTAFLQSQIGSGCTHTAKFFSFLFRFSTS